jgi:Domain of unknown function (DUF4232)
MNDAQERIRGMLREKAAELPPQLEVPPSLPKRAGSRIARNALVVAACVAAVTVVGVAGMRSLNEPRDTSFDGGPPTSTGPQTCSAQDLEPTLALEGAMGSREGAILFRNASVARCTLRGAPTVELIGDGGSLADIKTLETDPAWKADNSGEPAGWPVVTLDPGDSGSVRFRWSNWCASGAPTLRITASDGTHVADIPIDAIDVPPCNGPVGSTVEIGPFEPAPGS